MTTEQKITEIKSYYEGRITHLRNKAIQHTGSERFVQKQKDFWNGYANGLEEKLPALLEYVTNMTTDFGEPISDYVDEQGRVEYKTKYDGFCGNFSLRVDAEEGFFYGEFFKNSMREVKEYMFDAESGHKAKLIKR